MYTKGYLFCQNSVEKSKGLNLGVEPPRNNFLVDSSMIFGMFKDLTFLQTLPVTNFCTILIEISQNNSGEMPSDSKNIAKREDQELENESRKQGTYTGNNRGIIANL